MTHITWRQEHHRGRCPACDHKTVLIIARHWEPDEERTTDTFGRERYEELADMGVSPGSEVTGHWCPGCDRLTSLSLNS